MTASNQGIGYVMRGIGLLLWLISLTAMAEDAAVPGNHLPYLQERLALGQEEAVESLLTSLPVEQGERLRWLLLGAMEGNSRPAAPTRDWVAQQAERVPLLLEEQTRDGFLISRPRYDYPARARYLQHAWRQLDWQAQYEAELAVGRFELRSLYRLNNAEVERQQAALLAALDEAPPAEVSRLATELAQEALYLPDNRLAYDLLARTGNRALFLALWRRPVDESSLQALSLVSRFYQGHEAGHLLLAAAQVPSLNSQAMLALGTLRPLPDAVRHYLKQELGIGDNGVALAKLLQPRAESLQLILLADRLLQEQKPRPAHAEPGRP